MIFSLVVAMSLTGQQAEFVGPPRLAAPPRNAASARRQEEIRRTIEKRKAFKSNRVRSGKAREAAEQDAAEKAHAKAEADFKAALPFLVEAEKARLQRMSDIERNAALQQMAKTNDRVARAIEFRVGVPQYPPYNGDGPIIPRAYAPNPFPGEEP